MSKKNILCGLAFSFFILGCSTISHERAGKEARPPESPKEIQAAVGNVINTISGKKARVKYCPLCGKHYSANLETCSVDGTKLREIEE